MGACCCPAASRIQGNTFQHAKANPNSPSQALLSSPLPGSYFSFADPSPRRKKGTIFFPKETLRTWEVRIMIVGASDDTRESLAKWLTASTDSPRELRRTRENMDSEVYAHITKIMALSKEASQQTDPSQQHTPPNRIQFLVTTSLNLYAVKFCIWLPDHTRKDCDLATRNRFFTTPPDFEGNFARIVLYDTGNIASFEWARQWLDARATGVPPAPKSQFVSCHTPNQPVVVVGLQTGASPRAALVPPEEASSMCNEHNILHYEIATFSVDDHFVKGLSSSRSVVGDVTADQVLQSLVLVPLEEV